MRRIGKVLVWLLGLGLVVALAGAIYVRTVSDDPAQWHVDPTVAERTGRPNDFLVAPPSFSAAVPDVEAAVHALPPRELLFLLDSVASQSAGASILAGSLDDLWITYVQRTAIIGFPDYISVKAVQVEGGSALVIWSRSRFGHSDMGVNRKRIETWLSQIADG